MDWNCRARNNGLAKSKIARIPAVSLMVLALWFGILQNSAHAYPTLQLDILGGTFDWETETVTASADSFILYALLIPDLKNTLADTYFVSAALTPASGPTDVDAGSFTFNGATIDVSGLAPGYGLHFDLYNTKIKIKSGDVDVTQFAPFSHDAQTRKVPEPASLILLGAGLLSLGLFRLRKVEKIS